MWGASRNLQLHELDEIYLIRPRNLVRAGCIAICAISCLTPRPEVTKESCLLFDCPVTHMHLLNDQTELTHVKEHVNWSWQLYPKNHEAALIYTPFSAGSGIGYRELPQSR
jgi:hypothetical protein